MIPKTRKIGPPSVIIVAVIKLIWRSTIRVKIKCRIAKIINPTLKTGAKLVNNNVSKGVEFGIMDYPPFWHPLLNLESDQPQNLASVL